MKNMTKMDLIATVGEYTNAAGENKKRFMKVGNFFDDGNRMYVKIDSIPVNWNGYLSIKPPFESNQAPRQQYKGLPKDDYDADTPF